MMFETLPPACVAIIYFAGHMHPVHLKVKLSYANNDIHTYL